MLFIVIYPILPAVCVSVLLPVFVQLFSCNRGSVALSLTYTQKICRTAYILLFSAALRAAYVNHCPAAVRRSKTNGTLSRTSSIEGIRAVRRRQAVNNSPRNNYSIVYEQGILLLSRPARIVLSSPVNIRRLARRLRLILSVFCHTLQFILYRRFYGNSDNFTVEAHKCFGGLETF